LGEKPIFYFGGKLFGVTFQKHWIAIHNTSGFEKLLRGYEMKWLTGWGYCKKITIKGRNGIGMGYQMLFKIGESEGSSNYDFHLEGHSSRFPIGKNDSGDIRFTGLNAANIFPIWVEKVEGTAPNRIAYVWVKILDSLDNDVDIYCYYGNPEALNVSNGEDVFEFFDDFDGDSLDTSKWTQQYSSGGSLNIINSRIIFSSGGGDYIWIHSNDKFVYPVWVEAKTDFFTSTGATLRLGQSTGIVLRGDGNYYDDYSADVYGGSYRIIGDDNSHGWTVASIGCSDTEGIWSFVWNSTGSQIFNVNYVNKLNGKDSHNEIEDYYIYLGHAKWGGSSSSRVDWIRIRKYVDPTPTLSSIGDERTGATLSGTVRDKYGNPILGKTVKVFVLEKTTGQLLGKTTSDNNGNWSCKVAASSETKVVTVFTLEGEYHGDVDIAGAEFTFPW